MMRPFRKCWLVALALFVPAGCGVGNVDLDERALRPTVGGGDHDPRSDEPDLPGPCAEHCDNGMQDCGETGVDCGGECAGCAAPTCEESGLSTCVVEGLPTCVDLSSNPAHCGACSTACNVSAGATCASSTCVGGDELVGRLGPEHRLYPGRNPDVAADSSGNPHVVFDRKWVGVFYAKGTGTNGAFQETPIALGTSKAIEPRLFIDENDDVHVVWAVSSSGENVGGYEGWYTNNISGTWKAPLKVAVVGDGDIGDGGLTRISCGRVVKIPGQDLVVTAWMGKGPNVLVSVEQLAATPVVKKKVRATDYPIGLVALSSSQIRTVYRPLPGAIKARDYDLDLVPVRTFDVISGPLKGECADAFIEKSNGRVHYTGTPKGAPLTPSRIWYTNDERIAENQPLIGMVAAEMGGTQYFWADVCADRYGQAYITHSYIDTEPACTTVCDAYVSWVAGEELRSTLMAPGYEGMRVGPYCAPTAVGGIHVVYHLGGQVIYRTVGTP